MQRMRARQVQLARERPEAAFLGALLALDIEPIRSSRPPLTAEDLMRFVFTSIDPDNWTRRFYIMLDVSAEAYRGSLSIHTLN